MSQFLKGLAVIAFLATSLHAVNCQQTQKVQSFAERFYTVVLDRTADNVGLDSWTNNLTSGTFTGADVANGFIFSDEFINKNKSNEAYITILYRAFFNREPDVGGFNEWINQLTNGTSREDVLQGFLYSQEFVNLSNSYGIKAYAGASYVNASLTDFVERFYTVIFGRASDEDGLNYWTHRLSTGAATGADIAYGFIFSIEYNEVSKDNATYLTDLYRAFFNREADTLGFNGWIDLLNQGMSRRDVLEGFLGAPEFINLANDFGILAFEGAPTASPSDNEAPIAKAEQISTMGFDSSVILDASASTDSDGQIECYWWSENSEVINNSDTFTKDDFTLGKHNIRLTVVDNKNATASDSIEVDVKAVIVPTPTPTPTPTPLPIVYGEAGTHPITFHEEVESNMTTVYYPTDIPEGETVPVIFFASGYVNLDNPDAVNAAKNYESLLKFMASHGYYVIYAKHAWDNVFANLDKMLNGANGILPKIDTTRIGVVGHSLGAGYTFNILKYFSDKGYGENGRFIMALEAWYAFNLTKEEMRSLPSNTNVVMQQYGAGGNNSANNTDPRIPLTEFYLLDSITENQKDWQIYEDANHGYPGGSRPYSQMQHILKPLDALMEFTFKGTPEAHDIALEVGNDDPYNGGQGIQVVNPSADYAYKCYDNTSFDIDYCAMRQFEKRIDTNISITEPVYLSSYNEPNFDTNVTRITDRSVQSDNAHPYPKQGTAWNSDGSIIRMQYRLYDASTFEELPVTAGLNRSEAYHKLGSPWQGPADIRWSKSDPKVMYVMDSSQRYKKVILNADNTDKNETILIDLSSKGYSSIGTGNNEGNLDYEDKYVVLAAQRNVDDRSVYIMLYELGELDVAWTEISQKGLWKEKDDGDPDTDEEPETFDWVTVDPKAQYIVMSADSKMYRYDMQLNHEVQLANRAEHGDIGINEKGESVYIQMYSGGEGIYSYNLETLEVIKVLQSNYGGGHISCRNYKRPGWCYVNTSQERYKEVFAVKLDSGSGVVERLAQTHVDDRVVGCAQVNVSPDGKKVLFSSDWSDSPDEDYTWDQEHYKSCSAGDRRVKLDTYQVIVK